MIKNIRKHKKVKITEKYANIFMNNKQMTHKISVILSDII